MRTKLILVVFALFGAANAAIAGTAADACLKCHGKDADFSLAGEGADAIAEWLTDIRDGNARHPSDLTGLTDEQIAEIAAVLNGD